MRRETLFKVGLPWLILGLALMMMAPLMVGPVEAG